MRTLLLICENYAKWYSKKNKLYFHSEHIDRHLNLLIKFLISPVSLRWGSLVDWRILSSKKILVDLQSTSYETGNFCQQVLWTKNQGCWNPRKSESSNSVCLIVKKKKKWKFSNHLFFFDNPNHLFHEMSTLFWRETLIDYSELIERAELFWNESISSDWFSVWI